MVRGAIFPVVTRIPCWPLANTPRRDIGKAQTALLIRRVVTLPGSFMLAIYTIQHAYHAIHDGNGERRVRDDRILRKGVSGQRVPCDHCG